MGPDKKLITFWLVSFAVILAWSVNKPFDYLVWVLEAAPAVIGLLILGFTYKKFKFTNLTYWLIWIHAVILLIGAHYTYTRMPLFTWIKDALELSRNHYDRLGHIVQGFVPAIIAREILKRNSPLTNSKWLFFIVLCICLAVSAFYEIIEWQLSLLTGIAGEEFLALQGDIWDTHKDMTLALAGAIAALLILKKTHDKQLVPYLTK